MSDFWHGWQKKPKVYEDEPIPPRKEPVPVRTELRLQEGFSQLIAAGLQFWDPFRSRAQQFRKDAVRYAARESSACFVGDFRSYYTTYRDLPREVLEGYFGWRTRLRKGFFPPAPLSFKFLYVYEILAHVGISSSEEGYAILQALYAHYEDPALRNYLKTWCRDYIVYYGLGPEYAEPAFAETRADDRIREILRWPGRFEPAEVSAAMHRIGGYEATRSALLRDRPAECAEAMGRVYTALCEQKRRQGNPRYPEMFSGTRGSWRYEMFRNAVFCDAAPCPDSRYEIDPVRAFVCKDGKWRCTGLAINHPLVRNPAMTALMRETDRCLREALGFGRPLKPTAIDPELAALVRETVAEYDRARREALKPKVTLHRELLAGIRSDAADTMSRLLEGESEALSALDADAPAAVCEPSPTPEMPAAPETEAEDVPPAGLTAEEHRFLCLVLEGGDWRTFCAERKLLPNLLADAVNEKLMETVGDTVLEADGEDWAVIPDYKEELCSLLGQEAGWRTAWN